MKIYKQNDKIICELDFWQNKSNPYDLEEEKERTHNLIGIIAGEEKTISQLIDLSYKGTQQEGMPIIYYSGDKKDFIKLCKEIGIEIWEHEICSKCGKVIRGTFAIGEKGYICFDCENSDIG